MNKSTVVGGIIGVIVVIGGVSLLENNKSATTVSVQPVSVVPQRTPAASNPAPVAVTNTAPLMQSTGAQFSQYKYFSKSHQIFPTLAADTKKALGAFNYKQEDLGNNVYRFTLTNDAEGYKGQSVIVGGGQSVYFIEPANGDDSASEDSITTDDSLVAVDVQGNILK